MVFTVAFLFGNHNRIPRLPKTFIRKACSHVRLQIATLFKDITRKNLSLYTDGYTEKTHRRETKTQEKIASDDGFRRVASMSDYKKIKVLCFIVVGK